MRAVEKLYLRNAFPLEYTISATRVGDVLAGQFVPNPIGDARRRDSEPTVPLTSRLDPRAADAIVIFQRFQHRGQIFRIVLQIGVECCDESTARGLHSSPARRRFAAIKFEPLRAQP